MDDDYLDSSVEDTEEIPVNTEEVLKARDYQLDIFETARIKNSIVVLGTGSGKTFISVLLIKEFAHQIRGKLSEGAKRSFFVVNSVPLVYQQENVIKSQTSFTVRAYEGSMGVDFWSEEKWRAELEEYEVIVIMAQVFLNIILHKLIKISDINLIIMDECHHAQGNHPMKEIMREYCSFKVNSELAVPRICGMTASVINCKCSPQKVLILMKNLETILDSSLITSYYKASIAKHVTNAQQKIVLYPVNEATLTSRSIETLINNTISTIMKQYKCLGTFPDKYKEKSEKFINKLGANLIDVLYELGQCCLFDAVEIEIESLDIADSDNPFMKKVFQLVCNNLIEMNNSLKVMSSFANILTNLSPKVLRLLEILRQSKHSESVHTLIFIQKRNNAKLLYLILNKLSKSDDTYACLKVGVVVGGVHNINREDLRLKEQENQKKVINKFRQGELNLIVSTSVLEEGIDIKKCNLVIRFNIPQTFRSYIQSLGRARALPSHYIMMVTQAMYGDLLSDIQCYKSINHLLNTSCFDRLSPTMNEMIDEFSDDSDIPSFEPYGPLGSKITANSAIGLINLYCGRLPKDRFTNLTVDTVKKVVNGIYYVALTLPINASFRRTVWSEGKSNFDLAKKDAALRLCKELYCHKQFNSNLLPRNAKLLAIDKDHLGICNELAQTKKEIGTRRNRQIHQRKICSAFTTKGRTYLHAIKFTYLDRIRSDIKFNGDLDIGIICSEILPQATFPLQHMKWGKIEIAVQYIRSMEIVNKIEVLKFHQIVLTQIMKINKNVFSFDAQKAENEIYIVPIDTQSQIDYVTMSKINDSLILNEIDKKYILSSPDKLLDCIIKPQHLRSLTDVYFVKEVCRDITPQSSICEKKNIIYTEYFKSTYNIDILNVNQPLINVAHMPRNLNCISECKYKMPKGTILLHIPEKCDIFSIQAYFYWKLTCMPSILHRINGLQLEQDLLSQIRVKINYNNSIPLVYNWVNAEIDEILISPNENMCVNLSNKVAAIIPTGAILQALTPIFVIDQFNLERLEVLGDSYLKFKSSKYLFFKELTDNEGVLTHCRSNIISNKTLFLLAEKKHLSNYIQGIMLQEQTFPFPYGFVVKPEIEAELLQRKVLPANWNTYDQNETQSASTKPVSGTSYYNPYKEQLLPDKCISDTVESLIGAMLLCGGEQYATIIMKWLGFKFLNEEIDTSARVSVVNTEDKHQLYNMYRKNCLDRLEDIIGYKFKNKSLLLEACTHPTYNYNKITDCYQRLEFLGDAVLDYLITGYIYAQYREADPGKLTDWRSFYVNNETLARIAVKKNLHVYLLHLSHQLEQVINIFIALVEDGEKEFNFEKDQVVVEDIDVPKSLGDIVESIIGAVYVDSGLCLKTTWSLVRLLFDDIFKSTDELPINCVRKLYEKDSSVKFTYGEEDDRYVATAHVKLLDPVKGYGKNKRVAKQAAAKHALYLLDKMVHVKCQKCFAISCKCDNLTSELKKIMIKDGNIYSTL